MKVIKLDDYDALSREGASMIITELKKNKKSLLCAATGGSPTGVYEQLKKCFILQPELFSKLRVIKLDEWGGLSMNNPATCEYYLQKHLIGPLQITKDRYISFKSDPENPEDECRLIQQELRKNGPIDICILGLGMNGHLALNEPGSILEAEAHVANLSASSLMHPMIGNEGIKPSYGLTLGMADILQSSFILLLISGSKKKEITSAFLNGKISTSLPASFLKIHPNTVCLVDKEAFQ
jgi:galactosamine-6-phosphate isomerase